MIDIISNTIQCTCTVGVYPFFTFADKSIGDTIDTTVDMQLGCIAGDDLLLHTDELERLEFHSASDDEDFVIVDCRAPPGRSLSEPVVPSTVTSLSPDSTTRPLSEIPRPLRDATPTRDDTSTVVSDLDINDLSSI